MQDMDFKNQGFRVGEWEVNPPQNTIWGRSGEKHLQPRVMDLLVYFTEHAGQLLHREKILNDVWGQNAVSDEPLTRCIAELRSALGDDRRKPRYIETFHKRGYKFIAPVNAGERRSGADRRKQPRLASTSARRSSFWPAVGVGLAVFVIGLAAWWFFQQQMQQRGDAEQFSIAVLPFENLSENSANDYFSVGIAEELLNYLARVPRLRVVSRTSSFALKDNNLSLQEIGSRLKVTHVIEGSVRREDERVRIAVQLVDTRRDAHLWSRIYDREVKNILELQQEIAIDVIGELRRAFATDYPEVVDASA
ncbi:MAG: winged helix-turn-helix domain-containing protein, partial [Gammaproteobacteria bacterium]|nr:winged helix-turn-helix domain-containing protein [Gammaproteobacteria bacterium]